MNEDLVTEARRLLNNAEDVNVHYSGVSGASCSCGTCAFAAAAHNLVRGLLAEVDRLRNEIAEAREACPAVRMDRFSDAPLLALVNEQVSQLFKMQSRAEQAEAALQPESRSMQKRKAVMRGEPMPTFTGDSLVPDAALHEPRCLCTHRWAEHYGTGSNLYPARGCQRAGCECLGFEEPVAEPLSDEAIQETAR